MKVVVELELEISLPDSTEDLELAVERFLRSASKTPLGLFAQNIQICNVRKIQPWEQTIQRFK